MKLGSRIDSATSHSELDLSDAASDASDWRKGVSNWDGSCTTDVMPNSAVIHDSPADIRDDNVASPEQAVREAD